MGHGSAGRGGELRSASTPPFPHPRNPFPPVPAVESTFSHAAAPPSTSSTSFSRGYFLLLTCGHSDQLPSLPPPPKAPSSTPPAAAAHLPRDVPHVRTGGAGEAVAARPLLGHQHVAARRAEKQHRRIRLFRRRWRRRRRSWRTPMCSSCSRRRWRGSCRTRCSATSRRRSGWRLGLGFRGGSAQLSPAVPPAGDAGGDRLSSGAGVRAGHDGASVQGGRREHA